MNIFSRNTKSNFSEAEELGKEGITNYLQKDYNSAVKYLTKAIDISPQNITFLKYRGNAYEDLKEYRHAINDYLKINKIEEHHTNYHSIGFCYMQLNERQPAVDAYDNALRLKINNSNEKGLTKIKDGIPVCISTEVLYNNRAAARLKLQDFEGALSDVEKALQINPSYSKAEETKILIETAQGYSILTQNGNLGNNSSGNNKMEFKRRIISHANSSANALPNGLRLRDVIFLNYAEQIVGLGRIPYNQTIVLAREYAQKLFKIHQSSTGSLDDFDRGIIIYELSCAFSKIYPSLGKEEVFEELID